jgi:hypothetical protein
MAKRTVTTLTGDEWTVRRLWAPRFRGETLTGRAWRRIRATGRRTGDGLDVASNPGCGADLFDELAIVIGVVVVVLFVAFVAVPLLVALLDLLVLILLTGLGLVARVVFRRPWVVEALGPGDLRLTWRIVGWGTSGEAVDYIADALAHGAPPPPGHEVSRRPGAASPGA